MWNVKVKSITCRRWKWKGSNVKNEKLIMKSVKCEGKTFQMIRGLSASHLMAVKSDRAFISSLQCHRPFISIGKNVQDFQTNVWRKAKRRQSYGKIGRQILFGEKPKMEAGRWRCQIQIPQRWLDLGVDGWYYGGNTKYLNKPVGLQWYHNWNDDWLLFIDIKIEDMIDCLFRISMVILLQGCCD